VVHTDDIAWAHSRFGWADLLIEGDGAGRREVAPLTDALIWVQSDEREAERRALARIGKPNESPTLRHHREWMAEEIPFNAAQRTWERADLIVCGTPGHPVRPCHRNRHRGAEVDQGA
jgi:hypothetical protein